MIDDDDDDDDVKARSLADGRRCESIDCSSAVQWYGGGGIGVGVVTARSLLGEATHSVEVNVWICISDCS